MYLMIGKGHIAQRDNIWAKIDGRAKSMGKYTSQVVFWMHSAPVLMPLEVANGCSTYKLCMQSYVLSVVSMLAYNGFGFHYHSEL